MLTLLTIFITVAGAGFAFWFYNRRQVKNLADQIEDKNAVINAFRSHVEETVTTAPIEFNSEFESVIDLKTEKKKKRYNNKTKKIVVTNETKQQPNQKQNTEKKNRPNKQRRPKPQQ